MIYIIKQEAMYYIKTRLTPVSLPVKWAVQMSEH